MIETGRRTFFAIHCHIIIWSLDKNKKKLLDQIRTVNSFWYFIDKEEMYTILHNHVFQSNHSSTFNHLTFYARVIFRIVSKQLFFANVISRDYSLFISPGQECQFCCHLRHFSEPIMVISLNQGNEPLSLNSTPLYLNRLRSYYSP